MESEEHKREKTGGRIAGTPNKVTNEIRDRFKKLVDDNLEGLESDLKALKPADRVKYIIELAKFVMPTLKAVSIDMDDIKPSVTIVLGKGIKPTED